MFERLTRASRRVIMHAQNEARGFNHQYTGTEHVLLGLFHQASRAKAALEAAGVTYEMVYEEIEKWIGRGVLSDDDNQAPLNDAAREVLQRSIGEADQLDARDVEPAHLLLALLAVEDEEDRAKAILRALGLNLGQLRDGVLGRLRPADNESQAERLSLISQINEHAYAIKRLTDRLQALER